MKITLLSAILCLISVSIKAQSAFPQAWVGTWKGQLEILSANTKQPKQAPIDLVLEIGPIKGSKAFTWKTTYTTPTGPLVKDYKLVTDSIEGRYKIDEGDSILLDNYWLGNKLYCCFEVENMLFYCTYELQGDKLVFEIVFGPAKPINSTGNTVIATDTIPEVKNYAFSGLQRAVLARQ
jgi:hypothetical protein